MEAQKKEIAFGSQIRSYVLAPYRMVKDHRTGVEKGNVDAVLDGDLDEFVTAHLMGIRNPNRPTDEARMTLRIQWLLPALVLTACSNEVGPSILVEFTPTPQAVPDGSFLAGPSTCGQSDAGPVFGSPIPSPTGVGPWAARRHRPQRRRQARPGRRQRRHRYQRPAAATWQLADPPVRSR